MISKLPLEHSGNFSLAHFSAQLLADNKWWRPKGIYTSELLRRCNRNHRTTFCHISRLQVWFSKDNQ
jgi:hypothetical protein